MGQSPHETALRKQQKNAAHVDHLSMLVQTFADERIYGSIKVTFYDGEIRLVEKTEDLQPKPQKWSAAVDHVQSGFLASLKDLLKKSASRRLHGCLIVEFLRGDVSAVRITEKIQTPPKAPEA